MLWGHGVTTWRILIARYRTVNGESVRDWTKSVLIPVRKLFSLFLLLNPQQNQVLLLVSLVF